ncbi:MAG: spore maturation protein [Bacteroidetes bacterium]|nr:spore maturation protein [Bacteroidota bacterium]
MALNYIWVGFFLVGFVVALVKFFLDGDTVVFHEMVKSTFDMAELGVMKIALPLAGVMTLWLGFMNIGERAGAIRFMGRIVGGFFSKLFPEIPKNHPANGQLLMNFSANMLGLDNAATPMGLKAMQSLQELNPKKDTASNAQIMFLAINTSGLTIIPVSILALRATAGAANPTDIFIPLLIATAVSTMTAILYVGIRQRLNLWNKTVMGFFASIIAIIALLIVGTMVDMQALYQTLPPLFRTVFGFLNWGQNEWQTFSSVVSNLILLLIIVGFMAGALYKKVNVYDAFIDGAKDGFTTTLKIIPFMVGMLVAIGVFRASGAMELLMDGLRWIFGLFSSDTRFVDALPTALMKPLSGSGAKAMMVESMNTFGADSFAGRLSCLFQGAADTTFYIIALYFGLVGIKKTRYAVAAGLIADLAGVIAAIFVAYLFFG